MVQQLHQAKRSACLAIEAPTSEPRLCLLNDLSVLHSRMLLHAAADSSAHGDAGDADVDEVEAQASRAHNNAKWKDAPVALESPLTQFHSTAPECWQWCEGKQRWTAKLPDGAGIDPFTIAYTERKCRRHDCPAGLRVLDPPRAEPQKLSALELPSFAIFETRKGTCKNIAICSTRPRNVEI